jgi:catechol 2,3-dioxygenase-like lactoylglutathione lyase family enzyme
VSANWSVAPYFFVPDVVQAAAFYRDKLGFQYERLWGDPPAFCMVKRGGIVIMLSQAEGGGPPHPNALDDPERAAWDAYIWIDGKADQLAEEFRSKGVTLEREPCDQEYGCRDFEVLDLNGYRLCFGQVL